MAEKKIVPFRFTEKENVIELKRLETITYPYEWCFGQLRDAACLTLELAERSLDCGMILQDATAFNVAFENVSPVFLDHGSFCLYRPGEAWKAYRQFVMHFLAPLLLMKYTDFRCLNFFRTSVEGFPLDFASRLLPWKTFLKLHPLIHIHLHARMEKKYSAAAPPPKTPVTGEKQLRAFLGELRNFVSHLSPGGKKTRWADYATDNSYTPKAMAFKKEMIDRICLQRKFPVVVDLGANTGIFSEIAAKYSRRVIAADSDPAALEQLYETAKAEKRNILPVLQDLNDPSPGIGMFNQERSSFFSRVRGDLVMGLALIHHLHISGNWPVESIVKLFADMTGQAAVVEFVPREDPQVKKLLRSREDIFEDWTLENVTAAFRKRFRTCREIPIPDSPRVLLELYL
ncbi:MAG: class I SAM-dependent methyltransferase [Lentisphaeria bacterium]|nr:class I SAM-dependent methyltransferase [Lentisphaeria bacterium]